MQSHGTLRSLRSVQSDYSLDSENVLIYNTDISGLGTISRGRHHHMPADMAISNFSILFDHHGKCKPGDELAGQVIMDVWSTIVIRYVEFVIQGKGTVRVFKDSSTFLEKPRYETYLDKKIYLIAPPNGGSTCTLTPGKYVTDFSYRLPEELPPSVHQFEMGKGYIFDISYTAQANVCDLARTPHPKGKSIKVIKTCRKPFIVAPAHDWQSIPGAMDPIVHADQVSLLCAPFGSGPTSVHVHLDRGVYPIGDNIKIKVEVCPPSGKYLKVIRAELEQDLLFSKDMVKKFRRILITANDGRVRYAPEEVVKSSFSIPIPTSLVPSYLPHCKLLGISYCIKVTVQFRKLGGTVIMRMPLTIAPPSELERNIENPDVPLFNKPIMQFPYFSNSPLDFEDNVETLGGTMNGTLRSETSKRSNYSSESQRSQKVAEKDERVTTKYATCLGCCQCFLMCCGVGIYNS